MIDALEWIYIDILTYHQRAIRFFQGTSEWTLSTCHRNANEVPELKTIFRAMWKSYDTEFQGILQSLRRHKDLVERRASVTQYRVYQEDMSQYKARLDDQIQEEKLKKIITTREWLAVGPQTEDDHFDCQQIRTRYITTAKWIMKHEFVKDWIEANNPVTPCELTRFSLQ